MLFAPHIAACGRSCEQTAGRSARPKIAQWPASVSWMQRTPAGLPAGMPGIGELIDGAMQQAPQPARQSMPRGRQRMRCSGARIPRSWPSTVPLAARTTPITWSSKAEPESNSPITRAAITFSPSLCSA